MSIDVEKLCRSVADTHEEADTDADGEILPVDSGMKRSFCEPCKEAAEWIQAWHPGDYSFRHVPHG